MVMDVVLLARLMIIRSDDTHVLRQTEMQLSLFPCMLVPRSERFRCARVMIHKTLRIQNLVYKFLTGIPASQTSDVIWRGTNHL